MKFEVGSPTRARALGFVLILATFIVGAFSGAAFERVLSAREPAPADRCTSTSLPVPFHKPRGSMLIDRIDLTPEQRKKIDVLLDHRRQQTDEMWRAQKPIFRAIVDSTRAEIRTLLTDEQ